MFLGLFAFKHTKTLAFKCGHTSLLHRDVLVLGEMRHYQNDGSDMELCPDCQAAMAIRCGWCGDIIFPNEYITLYYLTPEGETRRFRPDTHCVRYNNDQIVGCTHCAEMGVADICGQWIPPGKVDTTVPWSNLSTSK